MTYLVLPIYYYLSCMTYLVLSICYYLFVITYFYYLLGISYIITYFLLPILLSIW